MEISRDYPRPILVNGYACKNCDDVSSAKKNIDPAEANASPSQLAAADKTADGGVKLSGLAAAKAAESATGPSSPPVGSCGNLVDFCC